MRVQKLKSTETMRDLCLDRCCLLEALRNYVNETGMEHFQLARKLGVDSWTLLEWIKGTRRPQSASLLAIRHFLEEYGPKYLPVAQRDDDPYGLLSGRPIRVLHCKPAKRAPAFRRR